MSIQARTDRNNNPAAFTTDIAAQAGLRLGTDYVKGDPFDAGAGHVLYTAKLIGNPIDLTIKVIDAIGYYTAHGQQRWNYIGIPPEIWKSLDKRGKTRAVQFHYRREGGVAMQKLFDAILTDK